MQDPGRRISVHEMSEHRFFDGPIRELRALRNMEWDDGTYVEDQKSIEMNDGIYGKEREKSDIPERILERKGSLLPLHVPKRATNRDTVDDASKRKSKEVGVQARYPSRASSKSGVQFGSRQSSRQSSGRDHIGLRTLLSEIGVGEEYHRREISRVGSSDEDRQLPGSNGIEYQLRRRSREDALLTQKSKEQAKENGIQTRVSHESVGGYDRPRVSSRDPRSHKTSHQMEVSEESYIGEKEAMHHTSSTSDIKWNRQPSQTHAVGVPSPGEGLRNALGNLENRIHLRVSTRDKISLDKKNERGNWEAGQSRGRKELPSLVEEPVKLCSRTNRLGTPSSRDV